MKIIVVGGVAAGMSCAARARRLSESAEIVVYERSHYVSFANCGLPYHIGGIIEDREQLVLQTPESLAETLNITVRIGHEVTSINRKEQIITVMNLSTHDSYSERYDRLVLCPGANPLKPNLPGIDHPLILTLRNLEDMDRINQLITVDTRRAIVIGAGYIGVEMAENLHHRSIKVDVVEMADQLLPPLDPEMARDLQYHMEYHGIAFHLGTAASSFSSTEHGLQVKLTDETSINTDLVIMAAGVRPDTQLAKQAELELGTRSGIKVNRHMQTSDPHIYAAGDAVEVLDTITGQSTIIALAGPANRQGRIIADHIFGRQSGYSSSQGTAIVKIFDMTGGGTGASEKTLKRNNIPYQKIYLHPSGHAGYYPGTAPMHFKLLFSPNDGQLLGAQIVGYDGVDKRIDVLATAIRVGLTVYDLEHLELGYAPPYGSAKDPVNMAGFVATNLIHGDIDFWYAEDFPTVIQDGVLVDVREPVEYQSWHIPGAINIPQGEMRARLTELVNDKSIYLYCRVGFRSYLAHRILKQSGFLSVKTLAGGMKTFCSFHRNALCSGRPSVPFVAHAEGKLAHRVINNV